MRFNLDKEAPKANQIPKELSIHGYTRQDPYFWLNERENPAVLDYLNAENAYTKHVLEPTLPLQEELYNEIIGRIKKDDESVPYFFNGYHYYSRVEYGKEHAIYCRKKESLEAPEEIIVDVNVLAEGFSFYKLNSLSVSPDNKIVAYSEDTVGNKIYTIRFKDLSTHENLKDVIENTADGIVWAADSKTMFYPIMDETLRPYKILRHVLGESTDVEVYHEKDETFTVDVDITKSRNFLLISCASTLTTECWILEANNPMGEFRVFQERIEELEYGIEDFGDQFYILTNLDAFNYRIMTSTIEQTEIQYWKELLPHREEVMVENFEVFTNFLAIDERENGLCRIRIMSHDRSKDYYIDFGEPTYSAGIGYNPEFDTENIRYDYSSLVTPYSTIDFNMNTLEKTVLKEQELEGGYDKSIYTSERIWVEARDGVQVPISLVYKKDTILDGSAPLLLYGYGAYGISMDATFSSVRLSLLNRGFVYAIAHIRGGEDLGREWYDDGRELAKMNSFYDFIDCATALIDRKYTSASKLVAMGGSAGGLLMGAVVNLAPQLFKGIIAAVPFVDVLTTMLDSSLPLTTGEYDEWGNPNEKEFYEYIAQYSPYDNIKAQAYPNILITTGFHDNQVQYWEPAKFVAKLRQMKTDQNVLMLHVDMESGHNGASGRFKIHHETAMEYAFILTCVNS